VRSQPLYAYDCARFIWRVVKYRLTGIYHIGGADTTTIFNLCRFVAQVFMLDERLVLPVLIEDLKLGATRPSDTTYALGKMHSTGFRTHCLYDGLQHMKEEREWMFLPPHLSETHS
jgi:dTDP-4-dehydrorhamnose reductase